MNAKDRCKQHSQGDKCRKELGHTDTQHEGQFTVWTNGASRVEKFPRRAPARDRSINRFMRSAGNHRYLKADEREGFLKFLDRAVKHFRGEA